MQFCGEDHTTGLEQSASMLFGVSHSRSTELALFLVNWLTQLKFYGVIAIAASN